MLFWIKDCIVVGVLTIAAFIVILNLAINDQLIAAQSDVWNDERR